MPMHESTAAGSEPYGFQPNELHLFPVAEGLTFPTSVTFDDTGIAYVAESGLPFGGAPPGGRVLRIHPDGTSTCLHTGLRQPVNGLTFHNGHLFIAEGGCPGRISRLSLRTGEWTVVLDNLPGGSNYHTNMVVIGPDGKLYFGQGAATNTGVVGLDAYGIGWLGRLPHPHDIPGLPITLTGMNFATDTPAHGRAVTGAFSPFGTPTHAGQRVAPGLPCTAAVMRCDPDGSHLELVAWGLRNPYGLGFLPDGRLLALDQGADDRGSRPIGDSPDLLFEVIQGRWYGWPDYIGGRPITAEEFRPLRGQHPAFLLANHDELPPPEQALLRFPVHASATKFCVTPLGDLIVALFGDERPMTAPEGPRAGRSLGYIHARKWTLSQIAVDPPLKRPIDVCFHPLKRTVHVLDFGQFEMEAGGGICAQTGTGTLYEAVMTNP